MAQQAVVIQTPIVDEGHSAPDESIATVDSVQAAPVGLKPNLTHLNEGLQRPRTEKRQTTFQYCFDAVGIAGSQLTYPIDHRLFGSHTRNCCIGHLRKLI